MEILFFHLSFFSETFSVSLYIILYTIMKAIIYYISLLLALLPLTTTAQSNMIIERYTTDDGLPSNTVNCITKDHDGFVWLGTLYGLSSFDGTEFTPYVSLYNPTSDIPPRKILNVVEDNKNNLWIRTSDNRFYRFDKTTDRFHDMYNDLRKVSPNLRVIKVLSIDNGNVLIYTRDKNLYEVFVDNNNTPRIKLIYNAHSAIDKSTLKLRHNVLGETPKYVFWLGPDFDVKIVSKKSSLSKTSILRTIPNGAKTTCFSCIGRNIYIGTSNGNVFAINADNGKAQKYSIRESSEITTISPYGKQIFFTTEHNIYSAYASSANTKTQQVYKPLANISCKAETSYADKYGTIWLYGANNGITMFDSFTKTCRTFPTPDDNFIIDAIKFCDAGPDGLFILLRNGKIMRYDRTTKVMQDFKPAIAQLTNQTTLPSFMKYDIPQNVFFDMLIDKEGLLWLSSATNGIIKVRFPSNHFSFIYSSLLANDINATENSSGIRSLLQTKNGDIWIATRQQNIYCIDGKTGKAKRQLTKSLGNVYHMMEDRKGNIWFSSKGNGLTVAYHDSNAPQSMRFETFKHSNTDKFSISDDKVYYTYEDSKGRIWVCTYGGGLNLLTTRNNKIAFINKNNLLTSYPQNDLYMNTRAIVEDNNNTLWIASTDGLLSFNGDFKKPQNIKFNNFRRGSNKMVVDNDIYSLLKDGHGNIWLSIFGCGINRINSYDTKSGKLVLDSYVDNGLHGNIVSTLVEDKKHRIWFTTENGLTSISENGNHLLSYGYLESFLRSRIGDNVAICLKNGNILIGCHKGLVTFSPDKVEKESHNNYHTFISDFKVQNRSLYSFDPPISNISPRYAKEIVLRHNQNMFSIEFSALDFTSSNTAFTYILDGYEEQWHANDNSRVASYANIPPGKYTFRVKSLDGRSSECTLKIIILPPWWQTWWAYCIYMLILIAAIYGGIRISLTMLKMRNEVYINNRLAELKIRFFTNISHELRTPLTLIKTPIDGLQRNEKLSAEGKEYLRLIDRNATRMLHLVNQILDFRKVQNNKMPMHLSHVDINEIIEVYNEEYRLVAKERAINLCIIKPQETLMAWCDAEKIGVIINNLINNAFKYTNVGGKIIVSIKPNDDKSVCRIRVEDNGSTIPEQQLETIFERFSMANNAMATDTQQTGTGIGLSLAREFAIMHHGRIWAENLPDNTGVAFTLEIPTEKDVYENDNTELVFDDNNTKSDTTTDNAGNDQQMSVSTSEQANDPSRPTLVLVEDNSDLRHMLQLQLRSEFNVVTAIDGADGLDKIKSSHPDIIITDLMMPRMDGAELLQRIRKDFSISHVPVIILTAKNGDKEETRLIEKGANAFITKPFSHDMLMARIHQLIQEQSIFQRKMILQSKPTEDQSAANAEEYERHLAKKDMEFINGIHRIIEENMHNEDFNIDSIAENAGLSRSAFFKKLKSLTGFAPVDLVREIRLTKAAKTVATTGKSISEIAFSVGFKESSYFGKCFKKKFGMTPLEYRNKQTSKDNNVNM